MKAALGLRVKSGWAAAVLLAGSIRSPKLYDSFAVELCDPSRPATRQPYHARMGQLETDPVKVRQRAAIVRRLTNQSVAKIVTRCRRNRFNVKNATLVVGSLIDPALVANQHIRAHALEGQLFRTVVERALGRHRISTFVLIEREAYGNAGARLKKPIDEIKRTIGLMGADFKGPWRAEQKLAALAAWVALDR